MNRKTRERLAEIEAARDRGETPLHFLLRFMRDEAQPLPVRLECAVSAARYCHPALTAVRVFKSIWELGPDEWRALMDELEAGPPGEGWQPRLIAGGKP